MTLGFLQEKANPGGYGSLTALSGIMVNFINELPIVTPLVCRRLHKQPTHIKMSEIVSSLYLAPKSYVCAAHSHVES